MRGEDLFRFEDAKREFGFHAATPDNLAALTTEQIAQIENRCSEQPEVTSAKLKYKLDSQKGEVILFVEPNISAGERNVGFSAADIKQVLQSFGLTPIDFVELKTK